MSSLNSLLDTQLDTQIMLIVATLFTCGAIIIGIASTRLNKPETVKELWQLYWVEFALVGMVLVPIYIGGMVLLLACLALALRGTWELYRIYDKPGFGTIQFASYLGSCTALTLVFFGSETSIGPAIFISIILLFLASLKARNELLPIAFTALTYPLIPLLFLIAIGNNAQGFLWLFFIYLVVELNDSLAYLTGKIFGKHHPFPNLSPRKSTEGLIGGLVISAFIGVSFGTLLLDLSIMIAAGAVGVILLGGLLGDFATSALKRQLNVKDFPAIHGFHGGALDIHDAYLFAVPSFYLFFIGFIQ